MAKQYQAPIEPPVPDYSNFDRDKHNADEAEYIATLASTAKQNGTSDLLGEIVRWPRADGYAQYMVWTTRPLALIHIATGDAWMVEDALMRGLRLSDIQAMVERERRIANLFSKSTA
jgi:hypothetical protein